MKKLLFIILLSLAGNLMYGQNNWLGKWSAYCVAKRVDNTINVCDLCPGEISEDGSMLVFPSFQLEILDKELIFVNKNDKTSIAYDYNIEKENLNFEYGGQQYSFDVLTVMGEYPLDRIILRAKEGEMLLLERPTSAK